MPVPPAGPMLWLLTHNHLMKPDTVNVSTAHCRLQTPQTVRFSVIPSVRLVAVQLPTSVPLVPKVRNFRELLQAVVSMYAITAAKNVMDQKRLTARHAETMLPYITVVLIQDVVYVNQDTSLASITTSA